MPSQAKVSGDPRKRSADKKTTSAPRRETKDKYAPTRWGGEEYIDLEVPSGQLCQVRRPGVEGLLKAGILHDMDILTPLIVEHREVAEGKRKKEAADESLAELAKDPAKVDSMMHLLDRVVCYAVVQPPLEMTPNDPTRRESGVVYADMVDLGDKMFILNYAVGGSKDLQRFREESEATLGDVQDHLGAEGSA